MRLFVLAILSRTARSAAASGGLRSLTTSPTRTECRPSDQGRFLGLGFGPTHSNGNADDRRTATLRNPRRALRHFERPPGEPEFHHVRRPRRADADGFLYLGHSRRGPHHRRRYRIFRGRFGAAQPALRACTGRGAGAGRRRSGGGAGRGDHAPALGSFRQHGPVSQRHVPHPGRRDGAGHRPLHLPQMVSPPVRGR